MKAIILAAGYATRLYPLTKDMPKALLPIREKPIINYIIDQLETLAAVDAVYVVSNHRFAPFFEKWAAQLRVGKPLYVLDDGTTDDSSKRGAIGDIAFALEEGKINDDVLVACGDNYFTFPLTEYYDFYAEKGADCVCAKRIDDAAEIKRYAVATLAQDGRVTNLVEKPQNPASDIAVFATYLYTRETAALVPQYLAEGNKPDAPGYFVQWLYEKKDVYAYIMNGECYDIGTPESYAEVQEL